MKYYFSRDCENVSVLMINCCLIGVFAGEWVVLFVALFVVVFVGCRDKACLVSTVKFIIITYNMIVKTRMPIEIMIYFMDVS